MSEIRFAGIEYADDYPIDLDLQLEQDTERIIDYISEAAQPVRTDYRTAPIREGFDWHAILDRIDETAGIRTSQLYLVVFRSLRRPEANGHEIELLDRAAHVAAIKFGRLGHYFADMINEEGRGLSWCVWESRQAARAALMGSAHSIAASNVDNYYLDWSIEQHDVRLLGNRSFKFDSYKSGPHSKQ